MAELQKFVKCDIICHKFRSRQVRLNNEIQILNKRVDDHEQREINNRLVLHGVEEKDNEDTNELSTSYRTVQSAI